ncbi:co-chaperone DjlA [Woeseia oceani]|uniref:Molecular chaperone DjlA n=1 Tax=Woeseia oceani TaxID=1548547 RepID=A0A193LJ31_9GAMM|nr:co-chaperone DjlA [Woeseia oceani]ANO52540.1 molecular chaperone DjlA [Woeseia oceani]
MLIFIGAIVGAVFGGFPGLLIGGAAGYVIGWGLRQSVLGSLQAVQANLLHPTFAIMGALCKADNVVTRDEIQVVERIFDQLALSAEARVAAKASFAAGKAPDFDLDAAVDDFAAIARGRMPLVQLFLQLQCMAVAADGQLHPAEHEMLVHIARRLGLEEVDVARLEALLRAATGEAAAGPGAPPSRARLADAYEALGLRPDASPSEIKRAYRKLMSQNHPDKLAARGLPESMRPVAEERSREINTAYDLIKTSRDFN